jgi:hypothetical protein
MDEAGQLHEDGQYTWVSDWVLALDLSPQALRLYVKMCLAAKDDESGGTRITLARKQTSALAGGDGPAAIQELLAVGAVTAISEYASGKIRYQLEDYPPRVKTLVDRRVQVGGKPIITYG